VIGEQEGVAVKTFWQAAPETSSNMLMRSMWDVSPFFTGGSAYPTGVGMRIKEIGIMCDRGKGRCSGEKAMAGFTWDLIKHINEVKKENSTCGGWSYG
jgi:hypothetical protein